MSGHSSNGTDHFDGAVGMTARENLPRDAVAAPERDLDAVTSTLMSVSEGDNVKLGIAVVVDGEETGGTSIMEVLGVETEPPNFDRRVNFIHHDGIANRLWITGIGNDGLDAWEIVSAPYDPVRGVLDSRDMAFHGWIVGAEVVDGDGGESA
jgi:hypothetical protein